MTLSLKSLSKTYSKGQRNALTQFSAELSEGIYALLGPNGAGKTTLMNIIAGIIEPSAGEVLYEGKSTKLMGKEFLKILGYMPQQQKLYDNFSAKYFLWYMAALKGLSRCESKERIEFLLELLHLTDCSNQKLGSFSGGMKQRVLIAQALLNDPKVLILDEPTVGLDPKERVGVRNFVSQISRDKIVIFATHVVTDIEHIAKEVIFLDKGAIICQRKPLSIIKEMQGHAWKIKVSGDMLASVQADYVVSEIAVQIDGSYMVSIMSNEKPHMFECEEALPTLEGVCLFLFREGKNETFNL